MTEEREKKKTQQINIRLCEREGEQEFIFWNLYEYQRVSWCSSSAFPSTDMPFFFSNKNEEKVTVEIFIRWKLTWIEFKEIFIIHEIITNECSINSHWSSIGYVLSDRFDHVNKNV